MLSKFLIASMAVSALMIPMTSNADVCVAGDSDAAPKLSSLAGFPAGNSGHYALPETTPTKLVVFAHGYRNNSDSWVCHLRMAAEKGMVAVATDYRGTGYAAGPQYGNAPASDNRGWWVAQGALDSIEAAQFFLNEYPSIKTVGIMGVSMGGNASGLAVAAGAKKPDGTPLFDYWVDVEGAVNAPETYAAAVAVEPAGGSLGAYAGGAREDMENAIGARPSEDPVAFAQGLAELSVVAHVPEIAAAGLRGVAVVHGADDGLVPYNQSREISTLLRAAGVSTSMYTVLRRNDWQSADSAGDEGGTVASGHALAPAMAAAGQSYTAPLAGHGWEGSSSHIVIRTGLDVLFDLMDNGDIANEEWLVDADLERIRVL